ncbi:hypothetical protein UT300012_24280 [Paraclostridium bifermentans]
MLHIDVQSDDLLQENLNKVISGLLPHDKYEPKLFTDLLTSIFKLINLEEFHGEYYVLMDSLKVLTELKLASKHYTPRLTREFLESNLQSNISMLVRNPLVRVGEMLALEGHDTNLELQETFSTAASLLYNKTLELYDDCFELEKDSNDAYTFIPALKSSFVMHTAEMSLRTQAMILNGSVRMGRQVYSGPADWMTYMEDMNLEVKRRISDEGEGYMIVDSMEKSNKLMEDVKASSIPLGNYGFPPIDSSTPMLRHRLVIVSAKENTGKTKFLVNCSNTLMRNGHTVAIMSGETTFGKMHAQLISNYMYQEFGIRVTPEEIAKIDEIDDDGLRRQINIARAKIVESKNLILLESLKYKDLYTQLVNMYERNPFDALFIDHSYALKGNGPAYDNQGMLALAVREFKNRYPVMIMVLTHLSSDAKDQLLRGKQVESSPTKGSAALSTEADEIFILFDNENLRKQGLLGIQNYKRRDAELLVTPMVVRKQFDVSAFVWDEKLQNTLNPQVQQLDKILDNYGSEDDDDEDDDDYVYDDSEW